MPRRRLATKRQTLIARVNAIVPETRLNLVAGINLTSAKTNPNSNSARSSERDHRDHEAPGDLIRRQMPRPVEVCDLHSMFQPVIQSAETLSGASSAEALCQ